MSSYEPLTMPWKSNHPAQLDDMNIAIISDRSTPGSDHSMATIVSAGLKSIKEMLRNPEWRSKPE
ncbi:hypothetical protein NQZ68_027355 [Dissostichus eleginoides]|nr:hypothetical protein NQZ68_027355 [Dissostichus eleginoides]